MRVTHHAIAERAIVDWKTNRQLGFIVVFAALAGTGFVFMTLALVHHVHH